MADARISVRRHGDSGAPFTLQAALDALRLEGCPDVAYQARFLEVDDADRAFASLAQDARWRQEHLTLFGRSCPAPRLTDWCGDEGLTYRYSRTDHPCTGWREPFIGLRDRIRAALGWPFDFVLANRYRDGADSMGWHADAEAVLGRQPVIASLSLGATRRFRLRHGATARTLDLDLAHGSLLVMFGNSQHEWRHCVPSTRRGVGERINLTFRRLRGTGSRA